MSQSEIRALIRELDNDYQAATLSRLLSRSESDQVYLSSWTLTAPPHAAGPLAAAAPAAAAPATPAAAPAVSVSGETGNFLILGSMNRKTGIREEYRVSYTARAEGDPAPCFGCTCPDFKFNSRKHDTVCKHICFVVCRVGRIIDSDFFATKRFDPPQRAAFHARLADASTLLRDVSISRPPAHHLTRELFATHEKPIDPEDTCPICFDHLVEENGPQSIVSCPMCKNYIHEKCMRVWLERQDTCVMCRSDCWRIF